MQQQQGINGPRVPSEQDSSSASGRSGANQIFKQNSIYAMAPSSGTTNTSASASGSTAAQGSPTSVPTRAPVTSRPAPVTSRPAISRPAPAISRPAPATNSSHTSVGARSVVNSASTPGASATRSESAAPVPKPVLKCRYCQNSFTNQSNLNKHLYKRFVYVCQHCTGGQVGFCSEGALRSHHTQRHVGIPYNKPVKDRFKCPRCSHTEDSHGKLETHARNVHQLSLQSTFK